MPACPLTDGELEVFVGEVAERLREGASKPDLAAQLADLGWAHADADAFLDEVEQRAQELGRPPRGCTLLRQSAHLQVRAGLLFALAGAVAAGLAIPLGNARAVMAVGAVLTLYGASVVVHGLLRLKRYQD